MATMNLGSKGEAFQLEDQTWTCRNELPTDVAIHIGEISFQLHKFPLLNRSGLLHNMINDFHGDGEKDHTLQLHDLPGGPKAFELVAKFCYDVKIALNAQNIVPLRCAAEHLRMTEEYSEGNLIAHAEEFLDEVLEKYWKDTLRILETCENFLPHAEDLRIMSRCVDSLAAKACADPTIFGWPLIGAITNAENSNLTGRVMWNGIGTDGEKPRSPRTDWWYEDVSFLSLSLYKRLILAVQTKGMAPETIAGSLKHYATRHLPTLSSMQSTTISAQSESEQRAILHEIVELLPMEKGVCTTRFLISLLRTAMIIHASPSCLENLEKRVGAQLDEATLEDILIPNLGYSVETLYDIDCVQRILESFMSASQLVLDANSPRILDEEQFLMADTSSLTPVTAVAKLVDGYLAEVASDVNLKFPTFQALAATIPTYARPSDDGIYRAIDIYLKSHPWLPDSDREQLCQLMNCQKLSLEACTHAAQNERLPLRVIVQVLFFEQLRVRTTIAGWFFVSDTMDTSRAPRDSILLSKNNGDRLIRSENSQEIKESDSDDGGNMIKHIDDEIKSRLSQLEKECLSIKQEIHKIGKHKTFWNNFCSKIGLRLRPQQHGGKQVFMEC